MLLKSKAQRKAILAPVIKQKDNTSLKTVTEIFLLTERFTLELDIDNDPDFDTEGRLINSFYARNDEFGECKDYLARVT